MQRATRSRGALAFLLLATVAMEACAPAVALPSASASPDGVLDAYLRSLVAGDCDAGRRLVAPTFVRGNGELCGATQVSAYRIEPEPARLSSSQVIFGTTLTTSGTADRSIRAGEMIWFYSLDQQADGSWQIVGGGSGP